MWDGSKAFVFGGERGYDDCATGPGCTFVPLADIAIIDPTISHPPPPSVTVTRPSPDRLYLEDQEVQTPGSGEPVVVGGVTLRADAAGEQAIDRVRFLVEGATVCVDTDPPYECLWTPTSQLRRFLIRAVARDTTGHERTSALVSVFVAA